MSIGDVIALAGFCVANIAAIVGVAWHLSARLTRIDLRLDRIEAAHVEAKQSPTTFPIERHRREAR